MSRGDRMGIKSDDRHPRHPVRARLITIEKARCIITDAKDRWTDWWQELSHGLRLSLGNTCLQRSASATGGRAGWSGGKRRKTATLNRSELGN